MSKTKTNQVYAVYEQTPNLYAQTEDLMIDDDLELLGIFTTRQKAQEFTDHLYSLEYPPDPNSIFINPLPLDKPLNQI